jgi:D-serine deaminase-like pyridoxal phosphate-dependent protein
MNKSTGPAQEWYKADNVNDISSPALLVYPDRIESNIRKMVDIAGDVNRLRPHVKTHKMPEVIMLQLKHGINKFKCSTISEAEMSAKSGARDILLAMQPVGPAIERFFHLKLEYPATKFSCITDTEVIIRQLSDSAVKYGLEANLWLDINNGMNRTGIAPYEKAVALYEMINRLPMLKAEGLHVYDGHIREREFSIRKQICDDGFIPVTRLAEQLRKSNPNPVKIVAGGSPAFSVHALREGVECSPGTVLLWDYGYGSSLPDMEFLYAAVLLTRVVSKPADGLICLDLGHKSLASEMPHPRIRFLNIDDYSVANHSEEHLVIKTPEADRMETGDILYGIPWHICPTVDRHDFVTVIENNHAKGRWSVEARKRLISI